MVDKISGAPHSQSNEGLKSNNEIDEERFTEMSEDVGSVYLSPAKDLTEQLDELGYDDLDSAIAEIEEEACDKWEEMERYIELAKVAARSHMREKASELFQMAVSAVDEMMDVPRFKVSALSQLAMAQRLYESDNAARETAALAKEIIDQANDIDLTEKEVLLKEVSDIYLHIGGGAIEDAKEVADHIWIHSVRRCVLRNIMIKKLNYSDSREILRESSSSLTNMADIMYGMDLSAVGIEWPESKYDRDYILTCTSTWALQADGFEGVNAVIEDIKDEVFKDYTRAKTVIEAVSCMGREMQVSEALEIISTLSPQIQSEAWKRDWQPQVDSVCQLFQDGKRDKARDLANEIEDKWTEQCDIQTGGYETDNGFLTIQDIFTESRTGFKRSGESYYDMAEKAIDDDFAKESILQMAQKMMEDAEQEFKTHDDLYHAKAAIKAKREAMESQQ